MKFSIRFADQVVGTLVILALVILVVVIFMLGVNQRWFVRDPQYMTYFSSGAGISSNMAVQYKGFTIGNVKKIRLAPDDRVEVIFSIHEEHSYRVREGSVVEIRVSPVGLGNSFHFYPGRETEGAEKLEEWSVIPELNSRQAMVYIATGMTEMPESGDSISVILSNVEQITTTLNEVLYNVAIQFEPILANLEEITDMAASPYGTIMSILDAEGPIFTEIYGTVASLSDTITSVGDNIDDIVGSISDAIASVSGIISNVEKTSDVLPSELSVLLSNLNVALRSAQDVLAAVANNPLLRGGVPHPAETGPGGTNPRNLEF